MPRPNILFIYTDQQRWDALGANGNAEIQTPNLDRLAARGVNFRSCFVQHPLCMPSRASALTGRYPSQLGITEMGVPVPEDTVTLATVLSRAGYHCANIGKLHFLPHANRDHRKLHPSYGFDQLEISDEPGPYHDAYRAWVARKRPDQLDRISAGLPPHAGTWNRTMGRRDTVVHPFDDAPVPAGYVPHEGGSRFAFAGGEVFPGDDDITYSAFVSERTCDYLDQKARSGGPFFCISSFYSPHAPWIVPQRFLDLYDEADLSLPDYPADFPREAGGTGYCSDAHLRAARKGYYAAVSEVDHHVGVILDRLEANGLAENTVIVFTSDHGEWLGDHGRFGKSYPAHDCVSRVPLLIAGPGLRASTPKALVEAVDLLPTLLDLVGLQTPPEVNGKSLMACLAGDDSAGHRESAVTEYSGWRILRTRDFRYTIRADGSETLFDLRARHGEYRELSADPAYASVLAELRHAMILRFLDMERPLERSWTY
ncbi:MAG: sulfatase-like hydrolase/transferase [Rhodobacteraceae bacterium]|nr:sulfatase-like hydrolase/transferase [Paracoccaceae bacterium]